MNFRYIFVIFLLGLLLSGCEKDPMMEYDRPEVVTHKEMVQGNMVMMVLTVDSRSTVDRVRLRVEGENGRFNRVVETEEVSAGFMGRLEGLKYNNRYTYTVEAGNCYGMERVAESFSFKIGSKPHVERPEVETLPAEDVTRTSAKIMGRFSKYMSGDERGFFFWSNDTDEKRIAIPGGRNYFRVYDLRPGTRYFFQAYVVRDGRMYRVNVVEFTTL